MSIPYTKTSLPIAGQLQLLISRGLVVADSRAAEAGLSQVSYFRLSAYSIPFKSAPHAFHTGATFESVRHLYELDEALRQAVLAALSPVEVLLRARVTNVLALHRGPFAQHDRDIFRSGFNHAEWELSLEKETRRARETFVDHFKIQYLDLHSAHRRGNISAISGRLSELTVGLLRHAEQPENLLLERG